MEAMNATTTRRLDDPPRYRALVVDDERALTAIIAGYLERESFQVSAAYDGRTALALARELAGKIARNAPLSNYLMVQSIARINDMSRTDGLFTESLAAALSQTTPDAEEGLTAFLEKRAPVFR